jgi:hypothetical protein
MSLEDIFRKHGTDKVDIHHYAPHYERHIGDFQFREFEMLEIGVGLGQSLTAWKEYFPLAKIMALDIDPKDYPPFKVYQGHQADPRIIAEITKFHGPFDVIIDDGSHRSEDTIATLVMLWQFLTPNGVYVIEDTQTSSWPSFAGAAHSLTTMSFLKGLVDGLNWEEKDQPFYSPTRFDRELLGISFYHNIAFLQKGDNQEGSNLMNHNICPWKITA